MGFFATLYMFTGLSLITLSAFGLCTMARLFFGHRTAKRLHEYILGYGMYYWMRIAGYWKLQIVGEMPPNQAYVIVSNHASALALPTVLSSTAIPSFLSSLFLHASRALEAHRVVRSTR